MSMLYVALCGRLCEGEEGVRGLPVFSTLEQAKEFVAKQGAYIPVLALDANGENLLDKESEST